MNARCGKRIIVNGVIWKCDTQRNHGGLGHYFVRSAEATLLRRMIYRLFR